MEVSLQKLKDFFKDLYQKIVASNQVYKLELQSGDIKCDQYDQWRSVFYEMILEPRNSGNQVFGGFGDFKLWWNPHLNIFICEFSWSDNTRISHSDPDPVRAICFTRDKVFEAVEAKTKSKACTISHDDDVDHVSEYVRNTIKDYKSKLPMG